METKSLRLPASALAVTVLAAGVLFVVKDASRDAVPDETLRDAVAALPPAGPAGGLIPGSASAGRGMARPGATPGAASAGLAALYAGGKTPALPEALRAALGESPRLAPPAGIELPPGGAAIVPGAAAAGSLSELADAVPNAARAGLRFERANGRWWAWTRKGLGPFLWHDGRWWWKGEAAWFMLNPRRLSREVWFVAHCLSEAGQDAAGAPRLVYSRDGAKAAVLIPGAGAWLFDAKTGDKLGRWPLQASRQEL